MIKALWITIFLIFSLQLHADSVSWYGKYNKALQASHKQNKDIMILLISSKDKSSMKIVKKLFMNKEYIAHLNKNYINILINVDYKTSYPIELFYTTTFPSLFFASNKDESFLIDPIYGLNKEEEVVGILEKLKINSLNK